MPLHASWSRLRLWPLALALLLGLAWHTPVVWPLKILAVAAHELGHAGATLLTGGEVVSLGLTPGEGGHTVSRGGIPLMILNAGYLASGLVGLLALWAAARPRGARPALALAGLVLAAAGLSWGEDAFAAGFCASVGIAMLLLARHRRSAIWSLRLLGASSVLYAALDLVSDRNTPGSDAVQLAARTGIPAGVWIAGWGLLGALALWWSRRALWTPYKASPTRSRSSRGTR